MQRRDRKDELRCYMIKGIDELIHINRGEFCPHYGRNKAQQEIKSETHISSGTVVVTRAC